MQQQKRAVLEGYTTSMEDYLSVKRPFGQAKRRLLGIMIKKDCQKFCCLPRSQSRGKVYNGGTVYGCLGGAGGCLAITFMLSTLSCSTIDPPCYQFGTG